MTIISTGPSTMPQNPNMDSPANTASSISAGCRWALLGTSSGRSTLSMLVVTTRWNTTTKTPPNTLPNNAIPMPSGMARIPLPSGMNASAVKKMTNMKNAS